MEFAEVVRRRRMVRTYEPTPIATDVVDRVLDAARRAPSAGFTQGVEFVVLSGPSETERYWRVTLPDAATRARFPWPGLLHAPVLVVIVVDPPAYVSRYSEADKAGTGLGQGEDRWPVPYWWLDAGMAAMAALHATVAEELGGLFFGLFQHEGAVLEALGVPASYRAAGTIALGHPAADDRPGGSAVTRDRRPPGSVVHRGGW